MVLKRDVCIIPPGRWIGSFSLQRCQSNGFEVCQLHKKSQTKTERKKDATRRSRERKVDVCILQEHGVVFCKTFSGSFIDGPNEPHEELEGEKWLKCSNWSVTAEILHCNRAAILICICGFSDGCFSQISSKVQRRPAGKQQMERESLNQRCRGGGALQSAPFMNKLQFKEKIHLSYFTPST